MKFKLLAAIVMSIGFSCATFAQVSSNEDAAREWIKANSREMNIQPIHTFKLSFVRKGPAGETLRFQQMLNDVPVIGSEIVVNFSNENKVAFSSNSYDEKIANINTNPSISKSAAISISNNDLRFKDFITFQEAKLGVKNMDGVTKLVYRVVTNAHDLTGSWEVIVDANTSAILSKKDIAVYYHNKGIDQDKTKNKENTRNKKSVLSTNFVGGTAYVFNPDPLSQAHAAYAGNYSSPASGTYPNDTDATNTSLDAARSLLTLPEIDFTSGVYKLKSTYAEIKELEAPSKGLFTQSTPDFLFNRSQDNFEAVNAFYHIDNSLRYINETLGIPCVPLTNNGVLYFDPSGVNGDDNSYYTSGTLTFGEGGVDDAEDADVILHELGHGLHDWITGGNSSSSTGLGEGSGDYWAMSYSRSLNQWASTDAAYNWVFSWDGHNEWWNGRVTNYTRTYPQTSATYTEIHEYGQIWATALMKIYDVIGRTKMDTAFLEGLALTNGTSNQKTAATAVRQAAINMNYPCADIQTMTTKFNAAGYALTALPLTMAPISNQTVQADASNTYTLPSYATLANPIVANCSATLTQTPVVGTVLAPGVYTITMVATSGTSVTRTFQLTVTPYLGVLDVTKNNIILYPNPATTVLNVKGDFDSNESITVYNVLGQVVMVKKISSTKESISIANLAKGVYNIHFNTLNATYKFVKE